MTLPFADKPEVSRVYADLKTKKLSQITDTEINALKASIFAEGVNGTEDEYRRLLLLQLLTTGIPTTGGGGTSNVNVTNSPLGVSVTNTPLPVQANVTNATLDVDVQNTTLDVDVQNTALRVFTVSGTHSLVNVSDTTGSGNPSGDLFVPAVGTIWQIMGISIPAVFNASGVRFTLSDSLGVDVIIGQALGPNQEARLNGFPMYVTAGMRLKYFITSSTGNCFMRAAMMQVK